MCEPSQPSCGKPTSFENLAPGKNISWQQEEICLGEPAGQSLSSHQSSYESSQANSENFLSHDQTFLFPKQFL